MHYTSLERNKLQFQGAVHPIKWFHNKTKYFISHVNVGGCDCCTVNINEQTRISFKIFSSVDEMEKFILKFYKKMKRKGYDLNEKFLPWDLFIDFKEENPNHYILYYLSEPEDKDYTVFEYVLKQGFKEKTLDEISY